MFTLWESLILQKCTRNIQEFPTTLFFCFFFLLELYFQNPIKYVSISTWDDYNFIAYSKSQKKNPFQRSHPSLVFYPANPWHLHGLPCEVPNSPSCIAVRDRPGSVMFTEPDVCPMFHGKFFDSSQRVAFGILSKNCMYISNLICYILWIHACIYIYICICYICI